MDNRNLKLVLTTTLCLVVVGWMCITAWMNIRYLEKTSLIQTQRRLAATAKSEAHHIETIFDEIQTELELFAQNPAIIEQLRKPDSNNHCIKQVHSHLQKIIDSVLLIDSDGLVQNGTPESGEYTNKDFSQLPGVICVLKHHKTCIGKTYTKENGDREVLVCTPVFDGSEFCGVLAASVDLKIINNLISHINSNLDKCYAQIINDDKTVIAHPRQDQIGKDIIELRVNKMPWHDWGDFKQIINKMSRGEQGTGVYHSLWWLHQNPQLTKKVTAYAPISIGNELWSIGIVLPYSEVSGPIQSHSKNIFLVGSCMILAFVLILWVYHGVSNKKTQLDGYTALSKVNEELQLASLEHERTIEELEKQGEFLNTILSTIPYSVFWKDRDSVYHGCNKNFADNAGIEKVEDVAGRTDYDFAWTKEQADFFVKCDREIIRTGIPLLNTEEVVDTPDGQKRVLVNKVPIRDGSGNITGVLGIFSDITATKEQAQQKSEVNTLWEMAGAIEEGLTMTNEQGDILQANPYFVKIFGSNKEWLEGKNAFEILFGSSANKWKEVIKQFKERGANKSLLSTKTVINGTGYAVKISPIYRDNKFSALLICLIESDKLYDMDDEIKQEQQSVESDNPIGKTAPEGDGDTEDIADAEKPSCGKANPKILVVDDTEENRMLMEVLLTKSGYCVTTCGSGSEAVDLAQEKEFDLVLMDIQMPDMDGLEATGIIKSQSLNTQTAIIAMTAYNTKGDELACIEAGCDDYISKPIKKGLLLNKLSRFMAQREQIRKANRGEDITSFLADNPDYTKTIEVFINNLPGKISEMQKALDTGDLQSLAFKVHALKGLGGFAGFPIYTDKAKSIEHALQNEQIDNIREQIDELSRLCLRTKLNKS